jgi:hypothetical protein
MKSPSRTIKLHFPFFVATDFLLCTEQKQNNNNDCAKNGSHGYKMQYLNLEITKSL